MEPRIGVGLSLKGACFFIARVNGDFFKFDVHMKMHPKTFL